ncbi:unnamed protein product [Schistosoma margrebowiei]|uniref:BHLH domain-containing protein n=1 Tax=Schistosoma margrebowiei TaxID=48269 RepID=A0AA85A7G9_9TREM|nr:unnamed protein product [Schistosoma margrebowiei]
MEPVTLSQIFNDPLFNDISESFLDGIDVNDFSFDVSTFLDSPDAKNMDDEVISSRSEKTTLESLLKSEPTSDVSTTNTGLQLWENEHNKQNFSWEIPPVHRSTFPQVKADGHVCAPIQRTYEVPLISRLLCDSEIQNLNKNGVDSSRSCAIQYSSSSSGAEKTHFVSNKNEEDNKVNVEQCEQKHETIKRAPHNAIEKRYRASINGKIDELRRLLTPTSSTDVKMNKSAVLRRAIDRIRELEERNAQLNTELMAFRSSNASNVSYVDSNSKSNQPTNLSPYNSNGKEVSVKKMKEYSNSFHSSSLSSASSSSLSSPPSLNSPPNFQLNNDIKFITNSQYSVSPPSSLSSSPPLGISNGIVIPSFILQHHDLYDNNCINNENLPTHQQYQYYHPLSSTSLLQSSTTQNSYGSQQLFCTPHSTVILPEQSVMMKDDCTRKVHRKRLADDSNGGGGRGASFTPTKARCGHLLVNHDLEVKKLTVPHVKEKFNLISTNNIYNNNNNNNNNGNANRNNTIQAQFPTVCQLLCETNSCSHTPMLTKANMPNVIVNQQNHPIGGGYNEVIARTTLCVAALCLIAFNPAQITNQVYTNNGGTTSRDNKISNARTLLSYFDTSTSTTSKSGNIIATIIPSSWLISIMYILQWCIALLLCSWACYKKHIHVHLFNYSYYWSKSRNTAISSYEVKSHFRQANLAISQLTWSVADYHLRQCLHLLDSTHCELTQSGSTISFPRYIYLCIWFLIKLGINLLSIILIELPCWLWMCSFKKKVDQPNPIINSGHSYSNEKSIISAAEVRLRLMELYLFDYVPKKANTNNSILFKFNRLLDSISLAVMCIHDFLHSLTTQQIYCTNDKLHESNQNIGISSAIDNKLPINLLPRQGVTLGLFLKRKLGMYYLGSLIIRMTVHVTLRFRLSNLWINWFNNSTFIELIISNKKLNSCAIGINTTYSSSSLTRSSTKAVGLHDHSSNKNLSLADYTEKNIINQILIELREHITCHCLKVILYGKVDQVKSLQSYIHLLSQLSPSLNVYNMNNYRTSEIEYEETSDQVSCAHWWAQMLNILWEYRCDQLTLPVQSSSSSKLLVTRNQSNQAYHVVTPQSLFNCLCLGDLVKVLSIINKFDSLEWKSSSCMLHSVCSSLKNLRKSCRNLTNINTINKQPSESDLQLDYMRFNFLAWSMVATSWFIDVLIIKLKNLNHNDNGDDKIMKTITTKTMKDRSTEVFQGFNDALYLLHQLVDYFNMPASNWIRVKLRNAEAVHRLLTGACPTRARFALLQNYSLSCLPSSSVTGNIKDNPNKLENSDISISNASNHISGCNGQNPLGFHDHLNGNVSAIVNRSSQRNCMLIQSPGC